MDPTLAGLADCSGFILSQHGWKSACSLGHRQQFSQDLEDRGEAAAACALTEKVSTRQLEHMGLPSWLGAAVRPAAPPTPTSLCLFLASACVINSFRVFIQAVDQSTIQFFCPESATWHYLFYRAVQHKYTGVIAAAANTY